MRKIVMTTILTGAVAAGCLAADEIKDSPEKLADPMAFIETHPELKAQRHWTEFATPEEIKLFEGDEVQWPRIPKSAYDLSGFNKTLLGSPVPPVGVHPRVLLSPQDLPVLHERLKSTDRGRKALWYTRYALSRTIWDPESSDGKVFRKLVDGTQDTIPRGGLLRVHEPHIGNLTTQFNAAALLCHFDKNEEKGRELASAVANFWKLKEPKLDEANSKEGRDFWRNNHQLVHNSDLGDNYDLTATWMNEEQKRLMRRVISKATKGKRGHGARGPARWFDTNWDAWDFCHVLNALSIEGEDGYDPEIYENALVRAEAFLTWGINENGTIFETNGKNGAGLHYQLMTMTAMARRGVNLFGHPHLRQMPVSQTLSIVPQGGLNINNGTWGCQAFDTAPELLSFFPDDKRLDWLTRQIRGDQYDVSLEEFAQEFKDGKRNYRRDSQWLLSMSSMAGTSLSQAADWKGCRDADGKLLPAWNRNQLDLPLTFNDPVHGLFTARSSNDKDALFIMFEARPDLNHNGHQSHSAGGFHLAALGKMWAVQGLPEVLPSTFNSVPRIDGDGFGHIIYAGAPKVEYLGAVDDKLLSMASANVENAWDHVWTMPAHSTWGFKNIKKEDLSIETDPDVVKFFKGTQNWKKRIWGGSQYEANWGPTMRIKQRPVQYAYRSSGIVRGNHPYAVVIDDLKMDDQTRNYEWIMQLPMAVRALDSKGTDRIILMHESPETLRETEEITFDTLAGRCSYEDKPAKGTPLLLVQMLGKDLQHPYDQERSADREITIQVRQELNHNRRHMAKSTKVLSFGQNSQEMKTQVLLIPFRHGDPMPEITFDKETNSAEVKWEDQVDHLRFSGDGNRTRLQVERVQGTAAGVTKSL